MNKNTNFLCIIHLFIIYLKRRGEKHNFYIEIIFNGLLKFEIK